jgi:SAM-dependent methyltransferase
MRQDEVLKINRDGWDKVAPLFSGVTALPIYGPLVETEEYFNLFDSIEGKRVLEIGCGDGHSLEYMSQHGASELWGIDLSPVQIESALEHLKANDIAANLIAMPMEVDNNIPKDYFEIVYSIYAIGWTTDLHRTFSLVLDYLKPGGSFIFSWEHPFYSCLSSESNKLIVKNSYGNEGSYVTDNWRGKSTVVMQRRKLSTYINELVNTGFSIEQVIECDLAEKYANEDDTFNERWYSVFRAKLMPTTIIIKARKL